MVLEDLNDAFFDNLNKSDYAEDQANETRLQWIKRKEEAGFIVDYPAENELFIDIDSDENWQIFKNQLKIFERNFGSIKSYSVKPSKSGLPKRHVRLLLPFTVTELQRIAFQAAFGSDLVREMISLARHRNGDDHPTLFLEKP